MSTTALARQDLTLREGDFPSFFDVPFLVYGARYPFVSPLKSDLQAMLDFAKNPFFEGGHGTFYTAFRHGRAVGRIAAHVHARFNALHNRRDAGFGFFDCEDDPEVAGLLLRAAEDFGRRHGCDTLRGNMNLTANQEIGVLTEGQGRAPFLAQIHNPEYIARLLEGAGYQATKPMTSFVQDDVQGFDPELLLTERHRALLADGRYRFRDFDTRRFDADVEAIREVLNAAMADNYLFVPMTKEEARFQLGPLKLVMDPALLQFAEFQGQPVGVTMCLPDVVPLLQAMKSRLWPFGWWTFLTQRKRLRTASVIIILARPEHQSAGVTRLLVYRMMRALKAGGYTRLGGTWIGDDNTPSLKSAAAIGMKPYHRLHMYERSL